MTGRRENGETIPPLGRYKEKKKPAKAGDSGSKLRTSWQNCAHIDELRDTNTTVYYNSGYTISAVAKTKWFSSDVFEY